MRAAFIIGSPRSGTTILGEILDRHPSIVHWYEPYFIWDRYFSGEDTDVRTAEQATAEVSHYVRKEFEIVLRKAQAEVIVDKSPEHSFKLPLIREIFPEAQIIHLVRDGRDVTLSIHREWERRRYIVENRSYRGLFKIATSMLKRHHFWRNRFQALFFELRTNASLNPRSYLNKSKWNARVGWGPRFPGWREALEGHSPLQFNALQWVKCEEFIHKGSESVPSDKLLEVRYENLVTDPCTETARILEYLGVDSTPARDISAELKPLSIQNWKRHFSASQLQEITPILGPMLHRLSYPAD